MTYAMTLDNSWELMSEEEMYDVNGGGIARSTMALSIDIGIVAISLIYAVVGAAVTYFNLAKISKGLIGNVLKAGARDALRAMISGAGRAFGIAAIGATVGAVSSLAGILFDFSIGGALAHLIDYGDGNYNGICFG